MINSETSQMPRKPRVGRPPKSEDDRAVLVPVRFPPDMLVLIDGEAEQDMAITGRSAMIRTLCAEALAARAKRR